MSAGPGAPPVPAPRDAEHPRALVVAVGGPLAGDDAVAFAVADDLEALGLPAGVGLRRLAAPPPLVELVGEHRHLVVVDAVAGSQPPGTVLHLAPEALADRDLQPATSHMLAVSSALRLGSILAAEASAHVDLVGVVIDPRVQPLSPLSRAVARAVPRAVEEVFARLDAHAWRRDCRERHDHDRDPGGAP